MKKLFFCFFITFFLTPILSTAQETENPVLENGILENSVLNEEASEELTGATLDSITDIPAHHATEENLIDTINTIEQEVIHEESLSFYHRLAIAIGIVIGLVILIKLVWFLFKRFTAKIENSTKHKIKPLVINKFTVLTAKQVIKIIESCLMIIKYVLTAVLFFIALPAIFSLFSATREFAATLLSYILNPLKDIVINVIHYIPNLFKIIIIVLITHYMLKALKFFATKIEQGKLVFRGFYTEWAAPTYKILQVLLWAFTVALIYPLLPGSDSSAFRGVSVFIGIIFSIGSTSAIGNLVAGLVITYMRPFKIGDRVQIKDITGFVVEKNLMVVRLKTHKNEYVTFPNLIILGSNIINYNTSSDEDEEGLIIFAEVTFGYSTPWQEVHDILINAALNTKYVQKKPVPFVLQTKLDDFYACYQVNCYTKDVRMIPRIYTLLYENIQNGFREAGLDMTSAHYRVITANK